MNKELIINVTQSEISIALIEDKLLVELNKERAKSDFSVGDIYLGTVRKIMPGLNAAFVNIGSEKDAFIHYLDLGNNFKTLQKTISKINKPEKQNQQGGLKKQPVKAQNATQTVAVETVESGDKEEKAGKIEGKIANMLMPGQPILVEIAKEAISTKGPRLTSDISLAGRHVVLMPLSNKISISQKIRSISEKKRLKAIAEKVLPKHYGIIIRTAAMGKEEADLEEDITSLVAKWEGILAKVKTNTAPALMASEMNRTTAILRDLLNGSFSAIYVDHQDAYEEIRTYIRTIEPDKEKIVKLYKGSVPIFDNFDITRQIKSSFGKTISVKKGAYIILEHTEALHVIDVNSGKRAKVAESQEQTAVEVNLNSVSEIARQLRLRDMGGIIVVDFIDMRGGTNRQLIYDKMCEAMKLDRAKHNILPLSKFGLMQITRQRVRPETKIEISEVCPTCKGSGKITPSLLLDSQIEGQVAFLAQEQGVKNIVLHTSIYTAAFLKKGFIPLYIRWGWKYKCKIKVVGDVSLGYIETKFLDNSGKELL